MKSIAHTDSCSVGGLVSEVKVSVIFRGAHTGVFQVSKSGVILTPNQDGTVSVGKANELIGTSILVRTTVNQTGPGVFFEVDYVLQGTMCGPYSVKDTFDAGDPTVMVRETITFN